MRTSCLVLLVAMTPTGVKAAEVQAVWTNALCLTVRSSVVACGRAATTYGVPLRASKHPNLSEATKAPEA